MDKDQLSHILHIQQASIDNRLVVFAGAGVSNNSGVPTWSSLIKELKKELPKSLANETDDLKIAQLYKDLRGNIEYMNKVKSLLKHNRCVPTSLHKNILALKPYHIITTNYDNLLEKEIEKEFRQYAIVSQDSDIPLMRYPNALIKMHGDFDSNNIVLTETDYYNYGKNYPLIRAFVISLFASKVVVFVGFSFSDLNLKMILNELSSILQDSMPMVYLVSTTKPDDLTSKYFYNKRINIVYVDKDDEALQNYKSELANPIGQHLDRVLQFIRNYQKVDYTDLVDSLYSKISSYTEEIRTFGSALRMFFPRECYDLWNPHSSGLQLGSKYFNDLAESLKTFQGKRQFIENHPSIHRDKIKQIAYYNYLYTIDSLKIIDQDFDIEKAFGKNTLTYFFEFDFQKLSNVLLNLRVQDLSYTIADLEYPYILYKLGDYLGAYEQYTKIISKVWTLKKYILYFICLYNIKALSPYLLFQVRFNGGAKSDELEDKLNAIDLAETLNSLEVSPEIRELFNDLITYKTIGQTALATEELNEKIHQQRVSAEHGGCSVNSNIYALYAKFERELRFTTYNFIIRDKEGYFKAVCKNTLTGILNSHATPSRSMLDGALATTKLTALDILCVKLIIFYIAHEDLIKLIRQFNISSLSVAEEASDYISVCIKNIQGNFRGLIKHQEYKNSILNLLYLLSISPLEKVEIESIYAIVLNICKSDLSWENDKLIKFLDKLIDAYRPNPELASKLLMTLAMSKNGGSYQEFKSSYSKLTKIISSAHSHLPEFQIDEILVGDKTECIFIIYPVVPDSLKSEFVEKISAKIKRLVSYLMFVSMYGIEVNNDVNLKRLIQQQNPNCEEFCSRELANLRNDVKYKCLHELIDANIENHKLISFYLSPLDYEDIEKISVSEIMLCSHEQKTALFKTPICREKLIEFLSRDKISEADRKSCIKYL